MTTPELERGVCVELVVCWGMQYVVNYARKLVSNGRNTVTFRGHVLDISTISDRLVGMSYPCEGISALWRNDVFVVRDYLTHSYGSSWCVFNLTESQYEPQLLYGAVVHCPIPDHHAPMLMRALDYVQRILGFLELRKDNVAVIHCLAGKGRTGTMTAMVLVAQGYTPADALAIFAIGRGQKVSQPSQVRYVGYFEKLLLQDDRRARARVLRLRRVELSHGPAYEANGEGSQPRIVLEMAMVEVLRMTIPHKVPPGNAVVFDVPDLELEGDVTLRCSHLDFPLFRVQLHTTFVPIQGGVAEFGLAELDEENEQPQVFARRFNPATKLRFFFHPQ